MQDQNARTKVNMFMFLSLGIQTHQEQISFEGHVSFFLSAIHIQS